MRELTEKEKYGVICSALFLVSVFFTMALVADPSKSLGLIMVNAVCVLVGIRYGTKNE